ncbi:MAG TPA: hypothetical protein VFO93_09430 [Hymenobacter sp.]|uniref:hypothetical protein n=1 Tax=Hymenobacter sp. TaxID=1898978 RepID=UPI002D81014D|nr:hypothetical protein [Hymenobacter sp.]HET9503752.1 hypothetical protein [Hymenobacter sp.]
MKKLLTPLVVVGIVAACQPQPTRTTAVAAPAAAVTTQLRAATKVARPLVAEADSLTPKMRARLRQVDLSDLFRVPEPSQRGVAQTVLDGFFGSNPQRLSLALLKVVRDSLQPNLFHVVGKSRYKAQTTTFTGTIHITSVADYYDQWQLLTQGEESFVLDTTASGNGDILNAKAYSAAASFKFAGLSPAPYALSGRALLDFWMTDEGKIGGMYAPCEGCVDTKAPSKGSVLLLRGQWLDGSAKSGRSFLVCRDVFFIANSLMDNFGIGDRGAQVNPKYNKFGWGTYWENDEWWADSPRPSLSL